MAQALAFDPRKRVTQHQVDAVFLESRMQTILGTGIDFMNRVIYLTADVDDALAHRIVAGIHLLDSSPGFIRVLINSNGGSESDGFAIYDALMGARNPVLTYGLGGVYSIAGLVFQAGGGRFMFPEAKMMIHNGSISIEGDIDVDKLQDVANQTAKSTGRYHQIIADRSGLTLATVARMCREETYLTATEACQQGLADQIVTNLPVSEKLDAPSKKRKRK